MEERNNAVRKLEVAVDTVNEATRPEQQVAENEDPDVKITPIQVKQMMKSFNLFDVNNDSTLDSEEMAHAFRMMGLNLTNKQLKDIVKEADVDKNGRVDEQEFTRLIMKHMQSREEAKKELREAFAVFDTYGQGRVSQEELIKTLCVCGDPLTDKEADQLMSAIDTNKDGYIDINEFVNFLTKSIPIGCYTTNVD